MSSDFGEFLPSEGACGTGFVAVMDGLPPASTDGRKLLGLRRSCLGGGPPGTMRSTSRTDLTPSFRLRSQGGKTAPHVDGGARSASF